jgi:hypothetical protein
MQGVRDAIAALAKKKRPALKLPRLARVPALRSPQVRLGSIHVNDVPPFLALAWLGISGYADASEGPNADGSSGNMNFFISAGLNPGDQGGNGSISCWTAIGQTFAAPNSGQLVFSASPSISWAADEVSLFWRQAAGNLWIGQVINVFNSDGSLISTPVATQSSLVSFDDYNLSGGSDPSGSNSGMQLSASLSAEAGMLYNCWVWMGGNATADSYNAQSFAEVNMWATVSSIGVDLF